MPDPEKVTSINILEILWQPERFSKYKLVVHGWRALAQSTPVWLTGHASHWYNFSC